MLRLDRTSRAYGVLPSDQLGFARGSWESWIVNTCAEQVGDEYVAAMMRRTSAQPVIVIG